MPSYATVEDVERMIGDIVEGRMFRDRESYDDSGTTKYMPATAPSRSQVTVTLERASSRIDAHLTAYNYVVPVATTNAIAIEWLQEVNSALASARILTTFAVRERDNLSGEEGEVVNRIGSYQSQVRDLMHAVEVGAFPATRVDESANSTSVGYGEIRDATFVLGADSNDTIGV